MDEETLRLVTDLHAHNHRQGPGSDEAFVRMLELSGIDTEAELEIADIGSGTGSSTIPLLKMTKAKVTAVDFLPAFLEKLAAQARVENVGGRVTTVVAEMAELPFSNKQFDVIWSEGAIYNIGFERGITEWKKFLKKNGILVVSEITWLTPSVPEPLRTHWEGEYSEIAPASEKIAQLENHDYIPIGYFPFPSDCWLENYYLPLQAGFADFLERHNHSVSAKAIIEAETKEIDLYNLYKDYYSYGVYIAKKM